MQLEIINELWRFCLSHCDGAQCRCHHSVSQNRNTEQREITDPLEVLRDWIHLTDWTGTFRSYHC